MSNIFPIFFFHYKSINHWIGLKEQLEETSIFDGKSHGFL